MLFSGIKKYIVSLIIKTSSDPEALDKKKVFLGKLNMILVQVLLYYALCCLFSAILVDVTTDVWMGVVCVCPTVASLFFCRSNEQAAVPVVSIYNEAIIFGWSFVSVQHMSGKRISPEQNGHSNNNISTSPSSLTSLLYWGQNTL